MNTNELIVRCTPDGLMPAAIIPVARDTRATFHREASYDVFVAPSGAVFEYGPSVMRVRGTATPCDRAVFLSYCNRNSLDVKTHAVVCGVRVALW